MMTEPDEKGYLKSGERFDFLHRNNYKIIQNPAKFCFGMDAVLLSGFIKVKPGETVLDLGTGTGIIPILLEAKTKGIGFTGLEIQEESAEMAKRSVQYNNLQNKITIVTGDIKKASDMFGPASFPVVVCNPPYMAELDGLLNPEMPKAIARHEILCSLEDVVRETSRILPVYGRFYMVHRPFRLADIFEKLNRYNLEPKRMKFVHPFVNKKPNMVLLECMKEGKSMITIEPPLIVYESQGVYTREIYDIYGY